MGAELLPPGSSAFLLLVVPLTPLPLPLADISHVGAVVLPLPLPRVVILPLCWAVVNLPLAAGIVSLASATNELSSGNGLSGLGSGLFALSCMTVASEYYK